MDIGNTEEKILYALRHIQGEYPDDYSDESYIMLIDAVFELGVKMFDDEWFKEIVNKEMERVTKRD